MPAFRRFFPEDVRDPECVRMTVDEFETLRLLDVEGMTQEECAARMNVSRTTVTAIYDSARKKTADVLVHGKQLVIAGGCCEFKLPQQDLQIDKKGEDRMRIAVTYENGEIYQHFGHTEHFKFYDIEDGVIKKEQVVETNGSGHGALAGLLAAAETDALICGGIGMGARMALEEAGITLYAGVSGPADEAVKAFASGTMDYDPEARCDHHGHHDGDCGHDHCQEHHCKGNQA